tara:strand:- start:105 stop:458 length:354 start_codon:yes stop_codon:yes gene_type:complete
MLNIKEIKEVNKTGFKRQYQSPQTHTITIGRNVGDTPLPEHKWKGFQSAISTFIKNHNSEIFVNSKGFGKWENCEEENFTWVFSTKEFLETDHLKELARLFKQDAIALTSGVTQLIG